MPVFFVLAGYTFRPKPWRELLLLLMWIGYTARQRGLEPSVSKPLLMTLPASWFFASIVRCACDIGLAYVIKKA